MAAGLAALAGIGGGLGGDDGEPFDVALGEGFGEEVFAAKYGQVDILPGRIEDGRLGAHSVEQEDGAVVGLLGAGSEAEGAAGLGGGVAGAGAALFGAEEAGAGVGGLPGEAWRGKFGQRGEQDLVGMGGVVVGGGVGNPYFGLGLHHDADVGEAAAAELTDEAAVGGGAVAEYPVAFLQETVWGQDGGAGRQRRIGGEAT
mgnify:CR=1 FL=1